MENIKILSIEECLDKDFGESVVQYQVGKDFVSFEFSKVNARLAVQVPSLVISELKEKVKDVSTRLLWSELSPRLINAITDNPFDMHFIEYDDEGWTEEQAEEVWEDARKHSLDDVVHCGEDDCYLTVYGGAMTNVNWSGHPEYGAPQLMYKMDERAQTAEPDFLKPGVYANNMLQWNSFNFGLERIKRETQRDPRINDMFDHLIEQNLKGQDAIDYMCTFDWVNATCNGGSNPFHHELEINLLLEGFQGGLSAEQVSLYAYPSYRYPQMAFMMDALKDGVPVKALQNMIEHADNGEKLLRSMGEYLRLSQGVEAVLKASASPSLSDKLQNAISRSSASQASSASQKKDSSLEH